MSGILVIRGGAIGDFILTLPAIKLLRIAFPASHLEILGYKHIVALAEMSGYANATRSIEYARLSSFFSRDGELAPELMDYFRNFQQVISYLFDPDEIFASNLRRAGVRNFIVGSPKITDQEHAARQLARPLEKLGLYLDDPAAAILPNEAKKVDLSLIALHPGSGSETKNWPLQNWAAVAESLLAADSGRRLLLVAGEADAERVAQLCAILPKTGCSARRIFRWWSWRGGCRTARFSSATTAAFRTLPRRSERLLCCSSARPIRRFGRRRTRTWKCCGRRPETYAALA